jgi:SAM-dependent methyltransferase
VHDFVVRRLNSAGAAEVRFVPDREAAREAANSILRERGKDGYLIISDIMNPITDFELARAMVDSLQRNEAAVCLCDGAIPGTQVDMVIAVERLNHLPDDVDSANLSLVRKRWFTQDKFNNQFNLYKYKRLKMFLCLVERLDDMHEMNINEFTSALVRDDIFRLLAAFGEDIRLVWHESCPHCGSALTPLPLRMSQPFCGYLPIARPLYHECERCGLVIASPVAHEDDVATIYDAFDKQDFVVSLNNPYHHGAARCDFSLFERHLPNKARTLDIGGGMGRFSQFLNEAYPDWVVTHSDYEIKQNKQLQDQGINTRALNILAEPIGEECYDLITAWEVIEHIPYHLMSPVLDNIHRALVPGGFFVFSTPDFDSPLCRSFDFFGVCPPFHYLVFGERWLRRYFEESPQWEYLQSRSCSDFLDDSLMWYEYGSKTCPSFQMRATSDVLRALFDTAEGEGMRRNLLRQGIGTEIIVSLRKT